MIDRRSWASPFQLFSKKTGGGGSWQQENSPRRVPSLLPPFLFLFIFLFSAGISLFIRSVQSSAKIEIEFYFPTWESQVHIWGYRGLTCPSSLQLYLLLLRMGWYYWRATRQVSLVGHPAGPFFWKAIFGCRIPSRIRSNSFLFYQIFLKSK